MTEPELLKRLKDEEADAAAYYSSELAKEQAEALKRYYSLPFGNEVADRSQVVTPDVQDAVNWALPGLLRPFNSTEDFLTIETNSTDGDVSLVADYIGHVFFKDNPGDAIIHDFAFDGLVQRVGIIKTCWEDPQPKPPHTMEGVSDQQLMQYEQDPEYEVLSTAQEPGGTHTIELQHKPRMGKPCVEIIAPEDFAISRRARSIKEADYHRIIHRNQAVSEVKAQFPDKADELDEASRDNTNDDTRLLSRFHDEADRTVRDAGEGKSRCDLLEEYIRIDLDGDGVRELRCIKRVSGVILENIVIEEPECSIWSPVRVAHKAIGLSLVDLVMPYQKIRTEITRRALDNMAQVLIPRKALNMDALDDSDPLTLQRIVNGDIGGTIPVRGDVRAAFADITTPDVSASAAGMLEYFDQRKQEASGITAHTQGADKQSMHDTATGVDLMQSSANARIEMMARWMAAGLEDVFNRILKLICRHQDQPRILKLRGKRMEINPSLWPDDLMVSVHVGMANATRERQLANLAGVAAKQEQILMQAGPSNPVVSLKEYRTTLARMVEAMGYKDASAFFKEIPQEYQPPEPGKDPKQTEVEGKLQLQQAEAQAKQQLAQIELQAKTQMSQAELANKTELARMQAEFDAQLAAQKAETERQVAGLKAQNELQIARLRIEAETQVSRERMAAEMRLAEWKTAQDVKLKRHQINSNTKAKGGKSNGSAPAGMGDDVQFGGQIG